MKESSKIMITSGVLGLIVHLSVSLNVPWRLELLPLTEVVAVDEEYDLNDVGRHTSIFGAPGNSIAEDIVGIVFKGLGTYRGTGMDDLKYADGATRKGAVATVPSAKMKMRTPAYNCRGEIYLRGAYLGEGGSGVVYGTVDGSKVVKLSMGRKKEAVEQECRVLQHIEQEAMERHLPPVTAKTVERCICQQDYGGGGNGDVDNGGALMVAEPLLAGPSTMSVSSLGAAARMRAQDSIVTTVARLLEVGVVTSDLQPLVSVDTGRVLLVDFSEGTVLPEPASALQLAAVRAFVAETLSVLPSDNLSQQRARQLFEVLLREATNRPAARMSVLRTALETVQA